MNNWQQNIVKPDVSLLEALAQLDQVAQQILIVVDAKIRLLGTVTDGDIRRGILRGLELSARVSDAMNTNPITALPDLSKDATIELMQVCDGHPAPMIDGEGKLVGLYTLEDALSKPVLENWAVIMAGGTGSRLLPLTEGSPKPLLAIGEEPILGTIISHLKISGFKNIMISVNYKAEMIKEYFGDGKKFGVNIEYIVEDKPLGTAGALGLIEKSHKLLERPFLLMNGDVLADIDFSRIIKFNDLEQVMATICVKEYFNEIPFGVARLDDHKLVRLEEKPIQKVYINAGIYVLSPEVIKHLPKGERRDVTEVFIQLLEKEVNIAAYPITEYWRDVGTHDEFKSAQSDFTKVFGGK